MLSYFKQILSSALFLFIALGSFCMSLDIHAGHLEHHVHASESAHHHDQEDIDCCSELQEVHVSIASSHTGVDYDDTSEDILRDYGQDRDYFVFKFIKNLVFPQSPPDNIKQRTSIRISTELLL